MQRKGLTSLEYCLLVIVVIAAMLSMQTYLKRAICGKWKQGADNLGFGRLY